MTVNEVLNVNDLTDILQQLTLIRTEQQVLKEEVTDLRSQVRAQQQRSPESPATRNPPRSLRRKDLKTGDQVTILNPKGNQLSTGTVVGFTPTGFVRVKTADQSIIRRFPFNLQK
jgi:hypothetical protein